MRWLRRLFGRHKRSFTRVIRLSSFAINTAKDEAGIEREMKYQRARAYVYLCRDLEHAGLLKITDLARTGDDRRQLLTLELP